MVPNDEEVWAHIASGKLLERISTNDGSNMQILLLAADVVRVLFDFEMFLQGLRADVIADESSDLFLHNPMFWQQPWAWYQYF